MVDMLNVIAETSISFDVTYRGRSGVMRLDGGECQWCEGGGRRAFAKGRMKWQAAFARLIDYLETIWSNPL